MIFFFRTLPPVPVLDDDMLVLSITMVDEDWSLELAASLLLSSKMSLMSCKLHKLVRSSSVASVVSSRFKMGTKTNFY